MLLEEPCLTPSELGPKVPLLWDFENRINALKAGLECELENLPPVPKEEIVDHLKAWKLNDAMKGIARWVLQASEHPAYARAVACIDAIRIEEREAGDAIRVQSGSSY